MATSASSTHERSGARPNRRLPLAERRLRRQHRRNGAPEGRADALTGRPAASARRSVRRTIRSTYRLIVSRHVTVSPSAGTSPDSVVQIPNENRSPQADESGGRTGLTRSGGRDRRVSVASTSARWSSMVSSRAGSVVRRAFAPSAAARRSQSSSVACAGSNDSRSRSSAGHVSRSSRAPSLAVTVPRTTAPSSAFPWRARARPPGRTPRVSSRERRTRFETWYSHDRLAVGFPDSTQASIGFRLPGTECRHPTPGGVNGTRGLGRRLNRYHLGPKTPERRQFSLDTVERRRTTASAFIDPRLACLGGSRGHVCRGSAGRWSFYMFAI